MKFNSYSQFLRMAAAALIIVASCVSAHGAVIFNDTKYDVIGDTILLDREGIFGCPDALTDPAEAFRKINSIGRKAVLLVAPSVYWLDDPDDPAVRTDKDGTPYAVRLNCDTLSIIGLSDNPEDVVFAVNRGQTQGAVGNFTMFHFNGNSLTTKNITFGNYCNVDLNYTRNPEFSRAKRKDAVVQAQIGICDGTDRLFAENCRFVSRLNLCPFIGARRSLYDRCYFECTDDALSGSAVYLDCRFTFFSSKPFYSTAETGAVFLNCDITCLGSGTQYFTKVPGMVTAIDTRFHSEKPIDIKWTRDASDVICRQENISLNGQPYTIDADRAELGPSLSGSPLRSAYKIDISSIREDVTDGRSIYNLPNLLNGIDGWDPKGMNEEIRAVEDMSGSRLTGLPVALRIDVAKPEKLFNGDQVQIRSTPLLWGGYPADASDEFTFVAENSKPIEKNVVVPVSTHDGLTARQTLTIAPNLREAPKFKKRPSIRYDAADNKLHLSYALAGKGDDDSRITWCRIIDDSGKARVLAVMEADASTGKEYAPKAGDLGYGLMAVVFPKFKDSKYGPLESSPQYDIFDPSQVIEYPESSLSTGFNDVPVVEREPGIPGVWSFDVFKPADTSHVDWQAVEGPGWYFGKGFDASTGVGLVQDAKGARMSYIPARDVCRDMTVSLIAEPAKSGGQGFGSATTQYMDICVKFDPVNLDGYALRIERTPDHDRAVRFSLMKYDNGQTSVISEEVISDCYRTPCHISVGVIDGILRATAYTEAPDSERKCCADVVEKVDLSVPVGNSPLTGFAIQHTGSWGPSSTLLRDLNINWK